MLHEVRRTKDLQNLRLVCKLFDDIFAPVVLSHIHLRSYPPVTLPGGVSLRDLTRRNESLAFVKSLTIYSLEWLVFQPEGFHEHCRAALQYLLLASTHPFRYLRSAKDTPSLSNEVAGVQGKYYLKKLQECILPNLESVKWYMQIDGPKTSRTLFLKVLVSLPSLKELDLSLKLYNIEDLDSFMHLLAQVSGLQKLTLRLRRGHSSYHGSYLRWFGRLIANNPNLAYLHLVWHDDATLSPLRVFRYLPVDRPTQLKHLLLDTYIITSEPDMIPHLRSLQSLNICWMPPSNFWETLALNGIFIPFLTVGFVGEALCKYLLLNASLVSFTIATPAYFSQNPSYLLGTLGLFRALETTHVAQITISPSNWARWYGNAEIEACLRRCAKLRRITLIFENGCLPVYKDIRATAKTVSRLGDKISLQISGDDYIHQAFRKCCQSKDPLMKSLQQRLVFLELQDLKSSSSLFPWSY
ncbi:hypothetical protein M378DRAFT_14811 [Amanita muscaria Koide BX008]|uniref:F-box domain-containing protein n=1 Tax=Amanita muscaria (strain Koide BX008) TaxID=946122 RepID=A0A0C2SZA9_AMAMK|nr:hypothetical protein M378DRAFT_14811 [Amanita muscaria Koide BX008]